MNNFLIDVNVLLDAIFKRDVKSVVVLEKLVDLGRGLYITASMIPTLDYFLKKHKADKNKFKDIFFGKFKVITSTGKEGADAIGFMDGEDALIALSFKRVCPRGVIVTKDSSFESFGLTVYTPVKLLPFLEDSTPIKDRQIPMLDLQAEYRHMLEDIDHAILNTVAETKYILGPQVKEFEEKIAEYIGVKHCIGVSSGTEALVLSLRALAIKLKGQEYFDRSDEIITTPFTFTATGDAILRSGATPVFIDIDPLTYNIDSKKIRAYLARNSSHVVGILPVHLYGQSCEMDEIMAIAGEHNLFVVEDVAQSFGGMWNGKKLGSIGNAGTFSFFPSKNLGVFGDGGMISTNDDKLAKLMRMLLKHGGKDKYNVAHIGYNARLDTLQAAILLAKFKYIDEFNEKRRKTAEIYNKELSGINGIVLPLNHELSTESDNLYHVYHQYTIRVLNGRNDQLQTHLKERGVSTMVYYPVPLHKMKVFEGKMKIFEGLENSENASKEVISLPMEPLQKDEDIAYVIKSIHEYFKN
ncbi:MAG: DegT/DnrJ/EryC1/StrS family aminotransferase [Candidatus Scalindua rubra]|uniref:Glutamine--scyllo-inositol transaminase n=1 Tax=Candidatus Scalindua brodae TaxID=237368 RepID=A0A0B0EJN0_9BACT|nr:MAG: glutamine--scyllo-inositol transaminase [Candidatus Scalindua brodae]MBZ0108453.1 DegT/DnrJ/EryC1/StrS family aminotransferase [Candidatus Scalindua rubra]